MATFILDQNSANLPVQDLLSQAATESVAVLDTQGNIVAYVLSPADREEMVYAEARRDLYQNWDQVDAALKRRGGVTTKELLERARSAAERASQS
jgi:hypothetical protein